MALRRLCARIAYPVVCGILRLVFVLLGGFQVSGRERVPRRGGVLICPNHFCDADAPALGAALPRHAHFMAKEELFQMRVIGPVMRFFDAFPVRRDSADRAALREAVRRLQAGEAVVIFPEGGGNADGTLQPLHPGAMLVALQAGVPVVPVAIVDANRVIPYGQLRPRRSDRPVRVTFGEPIDLTDLKGTRGAVETATRRLAERLAALLGQPVPEGKPAPHG